MTHQDEVVGDGKQKNDLLSSPLLLFSMHQ